MKKWQGALSVALIISALAWWGIARAASTTIVISQLQTGTQASASQEFIELQNRQDQAVDLAGWKLQYKSATSTDQASSWGTKAALEGVIPAKGFFLIAPKAYLENADFDLSPGLASGGGQVRLLDSNGQEVDRLGWGNANAAEGQAAPAPDAGQSLQRPDGDSDDNSVDFKIQPVPEPHSSQDPTSASQSPEQDPEIPPATAPTAPSVSITELLVDPASPLTDANDEFIELHNDDSQPADLGGYLLKSGSDFHDSYTLPAPFILEPGEFKAVYSSQSHLSLTNSGGAAELVAPDGTVIDSSLDYDQAPTGQSWALFPDGWAWTIQQTPGRPNIYVAPVLPAETAAAVKPKTTTKKTTTTKSAAKPKAAAAKSTKTLAAKSNFDGQDAPSTKSSGKWLLIALGGLTIGYAIYEFRYDLLNYYYLARRKLGFGGKDRPSPAGRAVRRAD